VPLIGRELSNGLVLAEESADEAALSRAIKEIDRAYVLQKNPDGDRPGLYVVACIVSEDEPPVRILAWADERTGEPLPLSSGLVEEVKKWRPEARGRRGPGADEINEQRREEADKVRADQLAAITEDHKPFVGRGRVGVALGARSKVPYWRKNKRPPRSGGDPA